MDDITADMKDTGAEHDLDLDLIAARNRFEKVASTIS